ncbi:Fluconazole resistance protein 1 [Fusarium torreyae]|uniref:Fluconazole resistance protein 1 n=1 Tax=Fusarium torreyae TaxID=1237075 RepID=A0A9W8VC84_9HYPO|nr:Fluconazole resistance protein 1 [Fusarium torreyae]
MLRRGESWDLPEPRFNDRNFPVVHDIAEKLKTIRLHSDIDLPVRNVFPKDDRGLQELQAKLEALEAMSVYGDDMSQYDQSPRSLNKEQLDVALSPSGMETISNQGSVSDISNMNNDGCVADFDGCHLADLQLTHVACDYGLDPHRCSTQSRQENNGMSFVSFSDQRNFDINFRCPSLIDSINLKQQDHSSQLGNSDFDDFVLLQSNDVSTAVYCCSNNNFRTRNLVGTCLSNESSVMLGESGTEAQASHTRDPTLWNGIPWMPEYDDLLAF